MESVGELVYRINKKTIDNYVDLFVQAELEWNTALTANSQLVLDYPYVQELSVEHRICFWLDKFELYKDTFLRTFLVLLQAVYCTHTSWRSPFYCMTLIEQELLFLVFLHLREHPEKIVYVRCLATNLWWQFRFLDS